VVFGRSIFFGFFLLNLIHMTLERVVITENAVFEVVKEIFPQLLLGLSFFYFLLEVFLRNRLGVTDLLKFIGVSLLLCLCFLAKSRLVFEG
jgi:hypothetical protein